MKYKTKFNIHDKVIVETETRGGAPKVVYDRISAIRITCDSNNSQNVIVTRVLDWTVPSVSREYVSYKGTIEYYLPYLGTWIDESRLLTMKQFKKEHRCDYKTFIREYNKTLVENFEKFQKKEDK